MGEAAEQASPVTVHTPLYDKLMKEIYDLRSKLLAEEVNSRQLVKLLEEYRGELIKYKQAFGHKGATCQKNKT